MYDGDLVQAESGGVLDDVVIGTTSPIGGGIEEGNHLCEDFDEAARDTQHAVAQW